MLTIVLWSAHPHQIYFSKSAEKIFVEKTLHILHFLHTQHYKNTTYISKSILAVKELQRVQCFLTKNIFELIINFPLPSNNKWLAIKPNLTAQCEHFNSYSSLMFSTEM